MKDKSKTESAVKDKLNVEVGRRIRSVRESLNMTRDCFSERCDISESFLSDVERGNKGITSKTLTKICETTNVSADYILFGLKHKRSSLIDVANSLTIEELETTIRYLESLVEMKKIEL